MWKNETKTKTKPSHVTCKLTTHSIVRFSPQTMQWIIKGCLRCLASGSGRDQGGLLVNGVLMFGSAWCLVMVQVYFSLMKRIEIGRSRHWLAPHLLRPMTSHFCLAPPLEWCVSLIKLFGKWWSNSYVSVY